VTWQRTAKLLQIGQVYLCHFAVEFRFWYSQQHLLLCCLSGCEGVCRKFLSGCRYRLNRFFGDKYKTGSWQLHFCVYYIHSARSKYLFHDLRLLSYLYHCVWSVITAHNLTPEKCDNNYSPNPLTPTSCLRNNIQPIHTGISASFPVVGVCNVHLNTL